LIGEFDVAFWKPQIGHGARLYRKVDGRNKAIKNIESVGNITLGDRWGKVEKISNSLDWFIHPGQTTDTTFKIKCPKNCSGKYWAHIADLPKEAPAEAGEVKIKITDASNKILFEALINRKYPMRPIFLETNKNLLNVSVNNYGKPDFDWLVFGFNLANQN
jgi:hypothetical protein